MTSSRSASVLDGHDLQQRDQLAGGGQPILHQAVVAELKQFLDPNTGGAQHLDDRPGPERVVLLAGQVAAFPGGRVLGPHLGRVRALAQHGTDQRRSGGGEPLARLGPAAGFEQGAGRLAPLADTAHDNREYGQPFAGPGIHP